MRKDLNKVMVERERRKGVAYSAGKGLKRQDTKSKLGVQAWPFKGESTSPYPTKVGMKKEYGYNKKEFNENLNPLKGFLRKSVGKNWDKVYSEVCKNFDKRKVINQHILQHLFEFVEVNTFLQGGKVCYVERVAYRGNEAGVTPIEKSWADYYVHPISKVLFANSKKKTYKQKWKEIKVAKEVEEKNNLVLLSQFSNQNGTGARYAIKINSIWYEISVIKNPEPAKHRRINSQGEIEYYTQYQRFDDISIHGAKFKPAEIEKGTHHVSRKTQLSSARLKKLGLSNS